MRASLLNSSLDPSLATLQSSAGELVFEQGDAGDGFYVIERGRAEVFIDGSPVRTMSVGEGFGEIALIRAARRTASVRATEPTTLRLLSRGAFVAAVTGYSSSAGAADDAIDAHLDRFAPALR